MTAVLTLLIGAASLTMGPAEWWERLAPTFEEGTSLYARGKYADAAEKFSQAIPANPHPSFYNRGLCRYRLRRWSIAVDDFDCAFQSATGRVERLRALLGLSAALLKAGKPERALPLLQQARELSPRNRLVALNLAAAYESREQFDAALQSLSAHPTTGDADLELWRAVIMYKQRHHGTSVTGPFLGIEIADHAAWPAAVERLGRALELRPDFGPSRRLLEGIRSAARSRGDTATLAAVERALARSPQESAVEFRPAALNLRSIPGDPGGQTESRAWTSYAGRWELLVLTAVVWTILLVYLRISTRRRQRALRLSGSASTRA